MENDHYYKSSRIAVLCAPAAYMAVKLLLSDDYQHFVKYMEIPCPPPMHMEIMASFLSVRINS